MWKTGVRNYSGLLSGLILFLLFLFVIPDSVLPVKAQRMAAVTLLMSVWWIGEAVPIPVTALLPILLFPLLKIMSAAAVTLNYGQHLVFLFLGGFIIALAIERWNLHKRIALHVVNVIGSNRRLIILGFMLATAFISMWISNTATAMMMVPIALAVISRFAEKDETTFIRKKNNFALALMLAIAYASSIGGIATLIGTPTNLVCIGVLKANFPAAPGISFVQWMMFAVPFSLLLLILAWFYLVYIAAPVNVHRTGQERQVLKEEIRKLGPMSREEKAVSAIFFTTALLWVFRSDINLGGFSIPGWSNVLGLKDFIDDSTVAIAMAVSTFIIPAGKRQDGKIQFLMDWDSVHKIPWGILLLFGGGFALADGFQQTGLTAWLGEQLRTFQSLPIGVVILLVSTVAVIATEFSSNTAVATTLLPVIAGLAVAIKVNPLLLMIPVTISCSTAFMLPVATPPNAIVFGSGYIRIKDMLVIGVGVNVLGLILLMILLYLLFPVVFQVQFNEAPAWILKP
jgi:solute carrier family 13 (sodium-dependent dicarboxylate transporter), member 2/3/5